MSIECKDLQSLIFQDSNARQYYNELPKNTRDDMNSYSNEINSYKKLQDFVENLLKDKD